MSLRVYNSLTNQKEPFEPVRPGKVGIYLCGPTVYKSPHIGHMVGPVIFDAIKRYLTYKGYEVTWIVNITDVEDKLIDAAQKTGMPVNVLAERYGKEYLQCLTDLGVSGIDKFPKASEHIEEIIEMCGALIERGFAYAADGNVYFDVTKDADYGKLSNRKVEDQESGTRAVEGSGKRNPADFALWKAAKPGEPTWNSPWGAGRPGWHIECSAMSMKYLGQTFDMHGGGLDLLFPHHENELAQSESATGKPFAKYWLHNGLTRLNTKKMSGSIGNVVATRKLLDEHGPLLLRYMLLSTHYRRPIEFSEDVLVAARKGLQVFLRLRERLDRLGAKPDSPDMESVSVEMLASENEHFARAVIALKMKFLEMMDDDFNTAGAIGVLHELAGEINSYIERSGVERERHADVIDAVGAAGQTLAKLAGLLGMLFTGDAVDTRASATSEANQLTDQLMKLLIQLRAEARAGKNFALADGIRKRLTEIGVTLEDRPDGTIWRRG
jgi:cysteinyl-tRNA synthetase